MTTTPKRKRGQHAKKHPWSNAGKRKLPEAFNDGDCMRWNALTEFAGSDDGKRASQQPTSAAIYQYFNAGYRAGKDAK